ncbi:MAG TPA: vitamin K epoxide reductase family protein [Streptosporangiaceae bacterium]|nr:vitamin K epoxide reductase family protein [Streptosporangiaceae bacterium]
MATRQTSSKSGKRAGGAASSRAARPASGKAAAAGKPARGAANTPAARLAKSTATASGGQPSRGGTPSPARRGLAGVGAACRPAVTWAGGGVPVATLIVSLLGLADAAYLTYQHFSQSTTFAGCSEKGAINCEAVTTSAWSHVGIFPVSVLGLAFFVFMVAVNSPWGWRAPWPAVHWARLASVVVGIVFVLYLVWAELFRINAICLYCTGVHVLTFILFGLVIGRAAFSGVRAAPDRG